MSTRERKRSERIELRATPADKALIVRAVAALETDLTSFAIENLTEAAHRVLADRQSFALTADALVAWEALHDRPPRDVEGLQALLERPSPFIEE